MTFNPEPQTGNPSSKQGTFLMKNYRLAASLTPFCSSLAAAMALTLCVNAAQGQADTYNEPAFDASVISSGLPDRNLEIRNWIGAPVYGEQFLLFKTFGQNQDSSNCGGGGCDYPDADTAINADEYIIFRFDLSSLPSNATILGDASMYWASWFTLGEGTPNEEFWGDFEVYEITDGDANWEGNQFADGTVSPGAVTYNSLGGTFNLLPAFEVDRDGDLDFDPFALAGEADDDAPLYDDTLVSNGGDFERQELSGIPAATVQRLISGESIGLAWKAVGPANFSIHSQDSRRSDREYEPRLVFDFTTETLDGDFNGDGTVDAADYTVWRDGLGVDYTQADYVTWENNFGATLLGSSSATATPEPGAAVLFALAGLGLALRGNR